jgi:hypothetical protein
MRIRKHLIRDFFRRSDLCQAVKNERVCVWAARKHGTAAERYLPDFALVNIGVVGRVADINIDADVWADSLGSDLRTSETNFGSSLL